MIRGLVVNEAQHCSRTRRRLTVMVAHPVLEGVSPEETTKLLLPDIFVEDDLSGAKERLAPNLYEAPVAEVDHVERETESYIAWIIVLGFVAYALAVYWAHRCSKRGGDPVIKFSVLRGFRSPIHGTNIYPRSRLRSRVSLER